VHPHYPLNGEEMAQQNFDQSLCPFVRVGRPLGLSCLWYLEL
jgi:hypothetical protein